MEFDALCMSIKYPANILGTWSCCEKPHHFNLHSSLWLSVKKIHCQFILYWSKIIDCVKRIPTPCAYGDNSTTTMHYCAMDFSQLPSNKVHITFLFPPLLFCNQTKHVHKEVTESFQHTLSLLWLCPCSNSHVVLLLLFLKFTVLNENFACPSDHGSKLSY